MVLTALQFVIELTDFKLLAGRRRKFVYLLSGVITWLMQHC